MPDDSVTYEGLTVRDKAKQVVSEMGVTGRIMRTAWMMEIEKALNTQIEDCAKLVDLAHLMSFSQLAKCIRALAESPPLLPSKQAALKRGLEKVGEMEAELEGRDD